jgi:cytochrome c oxidase cbb3-type subunit 4
MGWSIVNNLKDYFYTDWAAMTLHDWLGMGVTIVVFFVMVGLYVYIFHPSNKERLEAHRFIPLDDGPDFHEPLPEHSPKQFPNEKETEEQK